jgi:hypothetical protein
MTRDTMSSSVSRVMEERSDRSMHTLRRIDTKGGKGAGGHTGVFVRVCQGVRLSVFCWFAPSPPQGSPASSSPTPSMCQHREATAQTQLNPHPMQASYLVPLAPTKKVAQHTLPPIPP